jgi:hypothetical protein
MVHGSYEIERQGTANMFPFFSLWQEILQAIAILLAL